MENTLFEQIILRSITSHYKWQSAWEPFTTDPSLSVSEDRLNELFQLFEDRLQENYPFFHPRYAGQMLKPPHPASIAAYFSAMLINPNNHALDGGPATAKMEIEAVAEIARMIGYTGYLGHLTSSGTIANLEALWIARSLHPGKAIVFSRFSHYTHKRMCEVINSPSVEIESTSDGIIDLDELENHLKKGGIGTVVANIGTTSLGAIDPLQHLITLCRAYGVRVHADAAYGGFFTLLAHQKELLIEAAPFLALKECDSIVIDPHKHGLQPYGCGAILFRDPSVGRYYKHDSPYTYFTSTDLHLGEISLECSRPGAAAAALWFTLQCFPLKPDSGLGLILSQCRQAALALSSLLKKSSRFSEFIKPSLDIVTYFFKEENNSSTINSRTKEIFDRALHHPSHPVYLALLTLDGSFFTKRFPRISMDTPSITIFRSTLMKPEHLAYVETILKDLESF
jgi:glutamate/tyrosine decarboxylase-like PLP-dependent enzyme